MKARRFLVLILLTIEGIFCMGQAFPGKAWVEVPNAERAVSQNDTLVPLINFELISHADKLPVDHIIDMAQTDDGYVWIAYAEHGLVRYDGYHYRSFLSTKRSRTGIALPYIRQIVKSKRNGLWLLCKDRIIWFDLKTYKSEIIDHLPNDITDSPFSWACVEDQLGQLWVFGKGLYLYHVTTKRFEKISHARDGITGTYISILKSVFDVRNDKYVTLADDGSFWLLEERALVQINAYTRVVKRFSKVNFLSHTSILPDPDNTHIWTLGADGISKYNFKENRWLSIFLDIDEYKQIYNDIYKDRSAILSHIDNDRLWLSDSREIKIMDLQNFHIQAYKNEKLSSGKYNRIRIGIDGTKWIWNDKNELLCNFNEKERFTYHKILPEDDMVVSYWKDANIEWFGTTDAGRKGKLYRYDITSHKAAAFDIPSQRVPLALTGLNNQELLVSTAGMMKQAGKLYRFDKRSFRFIAISSKTENEPTLTMDSLDYQEVCSDKQNNIWLYAYKRGLIKYDPTTNQFHLVLRSSRYPNCGLFCSRDGFIWFGDEKGFVNRINPGSGEITKLKIFPDNTQPIPLCEDLEGNILITAFSKPTTLVALYTPISKKINYLPGIKVPYSNALIDSNNNIIALSFDGSFWLYNTKFKTARKFTAMDGLKADNFYSLYHPMYCSIPLNYSDKNEVLISDFYRIPIHALYSKKEVPLHLTSIKIGGEELNTTNNVDNLDTLILKYDQNHLSFEFTALSFLPHNINSYACMLQGLDTSWQRLGSNNAVNYASLAPGRYLFKVKTANKDGVWGKEKTLFLNIRPAFWQTVWFKGLVLLLVVAFFYWLYRNRLNQLNLENQLEKEKLLQQQKETEFQKRLADLTLSALRSQINPHFIFNCLNSIKLYATQHDVDTASDYLTKFSRLLRKVLDNSRNEAIPLADELEVLKLYIELEAMRFKDKLKYSISAFDIDTEYIEIPPLLLQPYVENAIWHGLMNKEGGGYLEVNATVENESTLIITIKDDGIGRAKAAELKSKTATQHKSFGMEITSERLALINQIYKRATHITIDDLKDDKGNAAGTQVTIQIEIP